MRTVLSLALLACLAGSATAQHRPAARPGSRPAATRHSVATRPAAVRATSMLPPAVEQAQAAVAGPPRR